MSVRFEISCAEDSVRERSQAAHMDEMQMFAKQVSLTATFLVSRTRSDFQEMQRVRTRAADIVGRAM